MDDGRTVQPPLSKRTDGTIQLMNQACGRKGDSQALSHVQGEAEVFLSQVHCEEGFQITGQYIWEPLFKVVDRPPLVRMMLKRVCPSTPAFTPNVKASAAMRMFPIDMTLLTSLTTFPAPDEPA